MPQHDVFARPIKESQGSVVARDFFDWPGRRRRLGVNADPLGGQIVVVKENPRTVGSMMLGEDLTDDRHGALQIRDSQVNVGITQSAAAAYAATGAGREQRRVKRVFELRAELDNPAAGD